jgi:hypothetical protein
MAARADSALGENVETLGFVTRWHSADGTGTVCQVDRGGCEIILCEEPARPARQIWPRLGKLATSGCSRGLGFQWRRTCCARLALLA